MRDEDVASKADAGAAGAGLGPTDDTRTSDEPLRAEPSSQPVEPRLTAPLQTRDPDRYEVLGEHGRGGLGRVFRAHDKELGRDIAVKELLERGNTTEVRFLREALITARLEHPGIVPVHEAGRWPDGTPFYAMKLVSGSPLKTLIDRAADSLDAQLALVVNVIAIADAIAYAHDRKIIHRDLKPSNVIVGEFGETVVIDWGLAKALDEQPTSIESAYRGAQGHELTVSGSVLGTPAYMAPEQRRGLADERSDIYALGGILFHVLVGHSPHGDTGRPTSEIATAFPREAPRDLVAIVQKAMAEEPAKRYATAQAFADDLRRYTLHRPVTARRYSLAAHVARAFARHRTASLAIVGALVASVAILVASLIRIDRERDDAESARNEAELARTVAEKTSNDLVLQHAGLLLKSDPTSAVATLARYRGLDATDARLIEAKARGIGVAETVPAGHHGLIRFVAGNADGSIVSVAGDHRVQLTSGDRTTTLAEDAASNNGVTAYAPTRRLLAYTTISAETVLFDLSTRRKQVLLHEQAVSADFSPDEKSLAVLTTDGHVMWWRVQDTLTAMPTRLIPKATNVMFADSDNLLLWTPTDVVIVSGQGSADSRTESQDFVSAIDARDELVVIGRPSGAVELRSLSHLALIQTTVVCGTEVADLTIMENKNNIAFACRDGTVGLIDRATGFSKHVVLKMQPGMAVLGQNSDGTILVVRTPNRVVVHDLQSGLTSELVGRSASVSFVAAPTARYPAILTGDANGKIRRWQFARNRGGVLMSTTSSKPEFSVDSRFVAAGNGPSVTITELASRSVRTVSAGEIPIRRVLFSPDGHLLAGRSDSAVYMWSWPDLRLARTFSEHFADLEFVDGRAIVSAGIDGRLRRRSVDPKEDAVLLSTELPLQQVETSPANGLIATYDSAGAVWILEPGRSPTVVRDRDSDTVETLKFSTDGHHLAIGTRSGHVTLIDTRSLTRVHAEVGSSVRGLQVAPEGKFVIVVTDEAPVQVLTPNGSSFTATSLKIEATTAICSPSCRQLGIVDRDGGLWIVDRAANRWLYSIDHFDSAALVARFSPDERFLASAGSKGDVVLRMLAQP